MSRKRSWQGRIYLGTDEDGREQYQWVGRFPTKRERDDAVAKARIALEAEERAVERMTVEAYAKRFLRDLAESGKSSSLDTARSSLKRFRKDFGRRQLHTISRIEAKDWAASVPPSQVPIVVTMMRRAMEDELIDRNPFRGLGKRTRGRSDEAPPTKAEMEKLLESCSALDWYAPQMRALLTFAAFSGMRPGELFVLEWPDIDFDAMRIHVRRRLYHGKLDTPKSNVERTVALTSPARDALLGHNYPQLDNPSKRTLVFRSLRGKRMSQPMLSTYWGKVLAKAGLDFEFYLATKHYCVHYLVAQGAPKRAIKAQVGWTGDDRSIDKLLGIYGHESIGALEEIDRIFAPNVVPLRRKPDAAGGAA